MASNIGYENKMCDILNKKNEECEKVLLKLDKDLGLLNDKRSDLMLGTLNISPEKSLRYSSLLLAVVAFTPLSAPPQMGPEAEALDS